MIRVSVNNDHDHYNKYSNAHSFINYHSHLMEKLIHTSVSIPVENAILEGELFVPVQSKGIIVFSHGNGSNRLSPRNQKVARNLQELNFGT